MGSRFTNATKTSTENNLKEHRNNRQSGRKSKNSFKSPVLQKRFKIEQETINLDKTNEKTLENNQNEKGNTLRRSKRKKSQDSDKNLEKTSSDTKKIFENGGSKILEGENLLEGCGLNLIPDNVLKTLDNELLTEETDMTISFNEDCTEQMAHTNQVFLSVKELDGLQIANTEGNTIQVPLEEKSKINHTLTEALVNDGKQNIIEIPQIQNTITLSNGNEIFDILHRQTENDYKINPVVGISLDAEIEEKCGRMNSTENNYQNHDRDLKDIKVVLSKINILTTEQVNTNGIENKNIHQNAKLLNYEAPYDTLNQLYDDIDKAHVIINALDNKKNVENNSTLCTSTLDTCCELRNESEHEIFSAISNKNTPEHSPKEDDQVHNENSLFELESSKQSKILTNSLQKSIFNKKELSTENEKTSNDGMKTNYNYDSVIKKTIETKHTIMNNTSVDHEKLISTIEKHDIEMISTTKFNKLTFLNDERKEFSLKVNNYSENTESDKSSDRRMPIQSQIMLNDNIGKDAEGNILQENLEKKRKKLTLLYMSALDYEKEDIQNATEMIQNGEEMHDGNITTYTQANSNNYGAHTVQEISEMQLQTLDNTFNKSGEKDQNTKINLSPEVHQNINKNKTLSEKEHDGYTQLDLGTNNGTNDSKNENFSQLMDNSSNFVSTDNQREMDKVELKHELTDSKHTNQNIHTHSIKNIFLSQSLDDTSLYDNTEVKTEKNKTGIDKWSINDYIYKAETPFLVTATECFKPDQMKSSTGATNCSKNDDIIKFDQRTKEENIPSFDDDENFGMDDDFNLTASQINRIEIDEKNNRYKELNETEKNSYEETGTCNNMHGGLDFLRTEINYNLRHIRETLEFIKNLLMKMNALLTKNAKK